MIKKPIKVTQPNQKKRNAVNQLRTEVTHLCSSIENSRNPKSARSNLQKEAREPFGSLTRSSRYATDSRIQTNNHNPYDPLALAQHCPSDLTNNSISPTMQRLRISQTSFIRMNRTENVTMTNLITTKTLEMRARCQGAHTKRRYQF